MSKTRKLLSVVLALVMVLSMFAVVANAAYYYEDEDEVANYNQNWSLAEPVDNGDGTYSVDVLLTTDYATGPIQFVLTNSDTSVAAIKSVTLGDAIPESYNATVSVSKAKGKVMIIADSTNDATITAEEIDGVIATVVYTYAGSGSAEIAIDDNAKSATNPGGTLIAARMSDGDVVTGEAITGQTVTVGASVVIGGGADPVLSVVEGTTGVIDEENGYVYGVVAGTEDLGEYFTVENGTFEMVAAEGGAANGTGATLVVKNTAGEEFDAYTLVIFGDVNGDGEITATDFAIVKVASSGGAIDGVEANSFAADVNGDGEITATDFATVKVASSGGDITVNPFVEA